MAVYFLDARTFLRWSKRLCQSQRFGIQPVPPCPDDATEALVFGAQAELAPCSNGDPSLIFSLPSLRETTHIDYSRSYTAVLTNDAPPELVFGMPYSGLSVSISIATPETATHAEKINETDTP